MTRVCITAFIPARITGRGSRILQGNEYIKRVEVAPPYHIVVESTLGKKSRPEQGGGAEFFRLATT